MRHRWFVKMWEEGHNFDLWHVSHFLAGVLFACLVIFLNIELYTGFLISFVLMVGWEVFEIKLGIKETKFNMTFDVIFSVIAFWLTVYLKNDYLSAIAFKQLFLISLVIYSIMGLWGFWAFKIRARSKSH